ncbi:MAG TPA: hypothetical protein PLQ93_10425, partial [Bacteroidia bacterium]|nr:hypothetical protein [Bacteroidia bacterium]
MRCTVLIFFLLGIRSGLHTQTKTSNASGNWNNPAIWTPTGVPTATDNVLINNGHSITFNASGS